MHERLLITLLIMGSAWGALLLMKRRQIASASRASRQRSTPVNLPTIVYFWSDGCSVCKRTQRPILEAILAEYDEQLALTTYNVEEAPDVAREWGVRTLPTTFVLDAVGTIRHVNNGLVVARSLRKQLEPVMFQLEKP